MIILHASRKDRAEALSSTRLIAAAILHPSSGFGDSEKLESEGAVLEQNISTVGSLKHLELKQTVTGAEIIGTTKVVWSDLLSNPSLLADYGQSHLEKWGITLNTAALMGVIGTVRSIVESICGIIEAILNLFKKGQPPAPPIPPGIVIHVSGSEEEGKKNTPIVVVEQQKS